MPAHGAEPSGTALLRHSRSNEWKMDRCRALLAETMLGDRARATVRRAAPDGGGLANRQASTRGEVGNRGEVCHLGGCHQPDLMENPNGRTAAPPSQSDHP